MVIDISAHLRRLVLAGLPLAGATGCPAAPAEPIPVAPALTAAASCQPRMIQDSWPSDTPVAQLGFQSDDPRVGDLYVACNTEGDYCGRLCQEALEHARPSLALPANHHLGGVKGCELRCDQHGRPILRIAYATFSGAIGRRPEGFAGGTSTCPGTSLAAYFADCARLEGASITAFVVLARELEHHRAPRALIEGARRAARDETRHFAQASRLARRFGAARVRCPRPERPPTRALAELARENAIEGCVNETFGAALALWQAATARDPVVRATMEVIASEEIAHAQLAWDVHAWARAQLTAPEADAIEATRAAAGQARLAACDLPVDPQLQTEVGLPAPAAARALATQLQPLWAS